MSISSFRHISLGVLYFCEPTVGGTPVDAFCIFFRQVLEITIQYEEVALKRTRSVAYNPI